MPSFVHLLSILISTGLRMSTCMTFRPLLMKQCFEALIEVDAYERADGSSKTLSYFPPFIIPVLVSV